MTTGERIVVPAAPRVTLFLHVEEEPADTELFVRSDILSDGRLRSLVSAYLPNYGVPVIVDDSVRLTLAGLLNSEFRRSPVFHMADGFFIPHMRVEVFRH